MPFLLIGVLFLVLLFVLEMILVTIVLGLVAIIATIIRHKWTCLGAGPAGRIFRVRGRGMRRVRRLRHEIAEAVRAGDIAALGLAEEC